METQLLVTTDQGAFDLALSSIREQGCASVRENNDYAGRREDNNSDSMGVDNNFASMRKDNVGTCRYNGPNGTHCAFGHLVKPELRADMVEGTTPVGAFDRPLMAAVDFNLLDRLQSAHDDAALACGGDDSSFMQHYEDYMQVLADEYGLTYTPAEL